MADASANCADPASCAGHVVLFGGFDSVSNVFFGDTWEWDGTEWSQRASTGPSPRAGHAMATLGGKVVLFGGGRASALPGGAMLEGPPLGDTWEWDGATWAQRNVSGPSARSEHGMATLHGTVVLFGGGIPGRDLAPAETWVWDGTSWTLKATSGPSARAHPAMTTVGDEIVLFGGSAADGALPQDVWAWDGTSWTLLPAIGNQGYGPDGRTEQAVASFAGGVLLFAGAGRNGSVLDDTWTLARDTWQEQTGPGPSPRAAAAMAAMAGQVVLFGGSAGYASLDPGTKTWTWKAQRG